MKDILSRLHLAEERTVYFWFSGTNLPSIDNLYALADILDVFVDDILVAREENT